MHDIYIYIYLYSYIYLCILSLNIPIDSYTTNTGLELRIDSLGVFVLSFSRIFTHSLFLSLILFHFLHICHWFEQSCTYKRETHIEYAHESTSCTKKFCEETHIDPSINLITNKKYILSYVYWDHTNTSQGYIDIRLPTFLFLFSFSFVL